MYNKGMGGLDLIDQRAAAYHLDRKSTIRFCLRIFVELMDVACANSYIVYNMMHPNDLIALDFKTIVTTYLIGKYTSRRRAPRDDKTGSKRKYQYQFEQGILSPQCEYCYKEGTNLKTYVAQNVGFVFV